jgi:hypothetical protein
MAVLLLSAMKIPFKSASIVLPDNKLQALGRLRMLGKKLMKDEHLRKLYTAGIHDMLRMGYAEKIDETQGINGKRWYVPHHGVCHPSKPGKVRIVFDCSAKYRVSGSGPNQQIGWRAAALQARGGGNYSGYRSNVSSDWCHAVGSRCLTLPMVAR